MNVQNGILFWIKDDVRKLEVDSSKLKKGIYKNTVVSILEWEAKSEIF